MSWRERPGAPTPGTALCRADELEDKQSLGFGFGSGIARFDMFVVREAGRFYGYVNDCPHAHSPLDWRPDNFLNLERTAILCGTHGAQFRITDGACLGGPCRGKALTPVPVAVIDGMVRIAAD